MYALASLGLRCSAGGFCVAGAALGALQVAFAWQARQLVVCKGSDVRPGVPWSPLAFAWHSLTHSARGRMHALASLGLCCSAGGFCVAGAALGALQVGCAPWRPLVSGGFCVAGAALGALQGVGCTLWRPLVSGGFCVAGAALGALQGVGCTPWRPLVSGGFCVAGFCFSARGRMYALASLGLRCSAGGLCVAGQAQHLVLCKGSDVGPGVPWSPLLCRWLLRGRRSTWCSATGPMHALASLGLCCSAGGFCVAGAALGALQGVGCAPWRPLVSAALPVAFAWQAQHLVLCKGSDVRPGVPWSPLLCRWLLHGRRSTWCSPKSRMYALASLGLRCSAGGFCVAGAALGALQGSDVRPGVPWSPVAFAWQARHLVLCKGSDVRFGVPWSPVAFAWQAQHLVLCKGSDVCPGVPWSPLLCRWLLRGRGGTWCSARGRMYALASLGLRWLLRGRRSTWCSARGPMYALASLGLRWLLRGRRGTWCSARGRMYALASLGLRCSAGGFLYWFFKVTHLEMIN